MGPSGCGKSTLLNVIAGLDKPDEGTVEVNGERIDGRDEEWLARFRRQHIGFVFQFFSLLDGVSAAENLMLPGILGGLRRKAAVARAHELLDLLGIGERGEHAAERAVRRRAPAAGDRAGAGQRARPAAGRRADRRARQRRARGRCSACCAQLHAGGQTIMMVTHAPDVAAAADRIVRLRDGRAVGQP